MFPRQFPYELVEEIVEEAWITSDADTRWPFYQTASCVSRRWRDIITNVGFRQLIFENTTDVVMYRKLVSRHIPPEDLLVEREAKSRALFRRSQLHIVVDDEMHIHLSGIGYGHTNSTIPQFVTDCKSMLVVVHQLPSHNRFLMPYLPLFDFMSKFPSLTHLYMIWPYVHINNYESPGIRLPSVVYLRIYEYPRCVCHTQEPHSHSEQCFSYHLPTFFPRLEHLHFDTPYILKCLTHPPSLQLVTLEAPPSHFIASRGYFSSVIGWNIGSALSCGFLKREHEDSPRRKIIVNSGPSEPVGWRHAKAACEAHGIVLELRCEYLEPAEPLAIVPVT